MKMKEEKIMTSAELLAERKWTDFLKRIPVGKSDWRISNYRDFISLRTVASILTKNTERTYSLLQDKADKTVYNIEVTLKNGDAQSF